MASARSAVGGIYRNLVRLTCAGIAMAVAGYELVQLVDLASDPAGNAEQIRSYLEMTYAPPDGQWRAIDLPVGGTLVVFLAAAAHLAIGGILLCGGVQLLVTNARWSPGSHCVVLGLLLGTAYYLVFRFFAAAWLQLSVSGALELSSTYMILAVFFSVAGGALSMSSPDPGKVS